MIYGLLFKGICMEYNTEIGGLTAASNLMREYMDLLPKKGMLTPFLRSLCEKLEIDTKYSDFVDYHSILNVLLNAKHSWKAIRMWNEICDSKIYLGSMVSPTKTEKTATPKCDDSKCHHICQEWYSFN
jgi:hypothetical protein